MNSWTLITLTCSVHGEEGGENEDGGGVLNVMRRTRYVKELPVRVIDVTRNVTNGTQSWGQK